MLKKPWSAVLLLLATSLFCPRSSSANSSGVVGELYDMASGSQEGTLRRRDDEIYQYDLSGQPKYVIQEDLNGNLVRHKISDSPFEDTYAGTVVRRGELDPGFGDELPQPTFQVFDEQGNYTQALRLRPTSP